MQVDANGDLLAVTWSPMFEGVLTCAARDVAPYYEAYRAFQRLIEEGSFAEDHTVRCRLRAGQCLVFNNRRLLHGREVKRRNHFRGVYHDMAAGSNYTYSKSVSNFAASLLRGSDGKYVPIYSTYIPVFGRIH